MTILFLYVDRLGKGYLNTVLFTIFISVPWFNLFNNNLNYYIYIFIFLAAIYAVINSFNSSISYSSRNNIKFRVKPTGMLIYSMILSSVILSVALLGASITGSRSAKQILERFDTKYLKQLNNSAKFLYSISMSGYSSNQRLGGPVKLNDSIVFRVKSDKPYYLRGIVKDKYTGNQWLKTFDKYSIKRGNEVFYSEKEYIDFLKSSKNDIHNNEKVSVSKKITIYPEEINTTTLFAPYNTYNIKVNNEKIAYDTYNTFLLLSKAYLKTYYSIEFYRENILEDNSIEYIKDGFSLDYTSKDKIKENSYYNSFLQLPNNISKQTYELLNHITKDSSSIENKLLKINEYLKANYKYSLDVSSVPDNKEFLDYFLFDEREGYCTYFATAAVVFSRMLGVPARYVEGFIMDETKDSSGLYVVGANKAHAWCEILLSEKSDIWGVFDCTPEGFEEVLSNKKIVEENEIINQWVDKSNNEQAEEAYTINNIENSNTYYEKELQLTEKKYKRFAMLIKTMFIIPIILMCLIFHYILINIKNYQKRKKYILNCKSIIPLYNYSKERLKYINITCKSSNSELDFINNAQDDTLKRNLNAIVCLYHDEYYGDKAPVTFDKNSYFNFIEAYIRDKQKFVKYYYIKFFKE
jgi:hypothetical protein